MAPFNRCSKFFNVFGDGVYTVRLTQTLSPVVYGCKTTAHAAFGHRPAALILARAA